jgi:pyruvate/2-oxoglutarate dehydrogenase complex dihydrolipoamide dehydrogenase (E3) component
MFESQFRRNEIDVLIGAASSAGPNTIRVANQKGEQSCDADYVLIIAGSRPAHSDADRRSQRFTEPRISNPLAKQRVDISPVTY